MKIIFPFIVLLFYCGSLAAQQRCNVKMGELEFITSDTTIYEKYFNNMSERFEMRIKQPVPPRFEKQSLINSIYSQINYFCSGIKSTITSFTILINGDKPQNNFSSKYNSDKINTSDSTLINKALRDNNIVLIYFDDIKLANGLIAPPFVIKLDNKEIKNSH